MHELIAWSGFVGAWLLVAGPLFQAALELGEEQFERSEIEAVSAAVTEPPPISRGGGCCRRSRTPSSGAAVATFAKR